MGSEIESTAGSRTSPKLSDAERQKLRAQRESLLSPQSPPDEQSTTSSNDASSSAKMLPEVPPMQKDDKDLSRASTAGKDKLRPLRLNQLLTSKLMGGLSVGSPALSDRSPALSDKDVLASPSASQSQSLERPSTSPSIKSIPLDDTSKATIGKAGERTFEECRTAARMAAKEAVVREKHRALRRKMQEDPSTRSMHFLQSLKHTPGIKLESAVSELKGAVASRYHTLFGALNASLHELQHALSTASDDSTIRDVDSVVAMHLERRRAIYHTKSAMASPTASREFSASSSLPRPPLSVRPHTGCGPRRKAVAPPLSVNVDRSSSSADLDPLQPQDSSQASDAAAPPAVKSGVRFAKQPSVRSLPRTNPQGSRRLLQAEERPPTFVNDLPGLVGTAHVNESLLAPAWPQAARIRQLKTEALVIKVSIARIRGLLPPSDCMSFPPMALVVSIDEDTRVVPLKVFFHSAYAHSCTVWKEPVHFEFVFDGILSECPLYVGVHRLADSAAQFPPDAADIASNDWQKLIGTTHAADGEHVMAGHGTFMGGLKAKLNLLPRNTKLKSTLTMSSTAPSTRSKQHFLAGRELRARGDKNYQNFTSAYEILERQRASKPMEHLYASQGPEKDGAQAERRLSEASEKTPASPAKPKRPKATQKRFVRITNTTQFMRLASHDQNRGTGRRSLPSDDALGPGNGSLSDQDTSDAGGDSDGMRDREGLERVSAEGAQEAAKARLRRRTSRLRRGSTFVDEEAAWVHGGPSVLERSMLKHSMNTVYVSLFRSYSEHEEDAALVLQRVTRGHKGRFHARLHKEQVEQLREEALRLGLDNEEQLKAARTIQVIIRFFWKSRTRKQNSPAPTMDSTPQLTKKSKAPLSVKDDGQGVIDVDVQLVNIEAKTRVSTSNLSYLQKEPTICVPCCGLRVTPQGIVAASESKVSYLKHVFPYATTVASTGKNSNKPGEAKLRMEEIDKLAKNYTRFQSSSPRSGQLDPATCTWVWEQVRPEHNEDEHHRPRSAASSQRVYRVRRYNLMKYEQRMLLRNEIASQVRIMSHCPDTHFEVLRNAFLESTPNGPYAVTVVGQDLGDVTLEAAVRNAGAVPEPVLSVLLRDLFLVVQQLHGVCGCIHNDLDLRNVYISRLTGEMKLGGFQFAQFPMHQPGCQLDNRTDENGEVEARRFMGPLRHQAPERMLGLECGTASDIWSLGVIARALVTGKFPWDAEDCTSLGFKTQVVEETLRPLLVNPVEEMVLSAAFGDSGKSQGKQESAVALRRLHQVSDINDWSARVQIGERTAAPRYFSREMSDLIASAMDKSPHKRPSTKALLAHRFFRRFRPDLQELKQWLKKHRVTLSAGDPSLLFLEENSLFKRVNSSHFISPARADALQGALARSILGSLL